MFFCTKTGTPDPSDKLDLAGCRGSAIIETLLIVPPMLLLCFTMYSVLNFWQDVHIDRNTKLISEVVRQNSTMVAGFDHELVDSTKEINIAEEGKKKNDGITNPRVPKDNEDYDGLNKKYIVIRYGNRQSPELKFNPRDLWAYIDHLFLGIQRKIIFVRGVNTWSNFLFLRGQSASFYETDGGERDPRVKWFNEAGGEKIDKVRKGLQLGS
ncbi:MAG: hypothetical protein LBP75_09155 [Planctomycetota bacterium]|jgi:hypothetical protein|nr:hypothetical protein [Planctomycetota bacterium]